MNSTLCTTGLEVGKVTHQIITLGAGVAPD